jgi:hypothetical protein
MAKNVNPFADDFEGMNKSADDKVIALLKQASGTNKQNKASVSVSKNAKAPDTSPPKEQSPNNEKLAQKQKRSPSQKKPTLSVSAEKPIVSFNTRITERLAEGVDDLVFQFRKKKDPRSKQELAMEALEDLLKKYKVSV